MEWQHFVEWLFYGALTAVGSYGVFVLSRLQQSAENLNIKIAVVVTHIEGHERRISRLEDH